MRILVLLFCEWPRIDELSSPVLVHVKVDGSDLSLYVQTAFCHGGKAGALPFFFLNAFH